MIESGICTAKQEYLHLSMEQDFYLIMLSGKPDSVVDIFLIHPNWHHDDESLLNGLLVSYPQGPKEGDPDLFRHYARLVIERLVELWGYRNSYDLISNQATKLFQIYGKTPSKLAMITASMIDNQ